MAFHRNSLGTASLIKGVRKSCQDLFETFFVDLGPWFMLFFDDVGL